MWSNNVELDNFLLQDNTDDIEDEIDQFWDYTDGYALLLSYEFDTTYSDGTQLGACLTSETDAQAQTCWAMTLASGEASNFVSFYFTSTISSSLDLSGETPETETCAWN